MERSLAHIEVINDIQPIPDADQIEVATVLGWKCVIAKKDNFKIGDNIIYIEVDSVLPKEPQYEFLEKYKYRIKTRKLRGQISQGLVLPLPNVGRDFKYNVGDDVTELMGITKYLSQSEQEEFTQQLKMHHWTKQYKLTNELWKYKWFRRYVLPNTSPSKWPGQIAKSDEPRIQNFTNILEEYGDKIVYSTEKIDYQSATFTSSKVPRYKLLGKLIQKVKFTVCSRNLVNNDKNSLYWNIAKLYNLEKICKKYPGIAIQGEQGSPKVQKNKYQLKDPRLWIFTIKMPNGKYLDWDEMKKFCIDNDLVHPNKEALPHRFPLVPFIECFKLSDKFKSIDDIIKYSEGKSIVNNQIQREGVVIRCIEDGKKILSFKSINPKFLIKYQDEE